jgi:hypothetical protein
VIVNPDKPAEENLPRRQPPQQAKSGLAGGPGHGDTEKTQANAGLEKPVLKTVSAKTAAASTKPAIAKQTTKPVIKKAASKPVAKKATKKPVHRGDAEAQRKQIAAKK